jgi:WD40 repeat protein
MAKTTNSPGRDEPPGFSLRLRIPVHRVDGSGSAISWSCDGTRIAMAHRSGCDVLDIDTDVWESRRAFSIEWENGYSSSYFVAWSPTDPEVLVLTHGDKITLVRVDADGRGCSRVWQAPYGSDRGLRSTMSFSPAGDHIAIARPSSDVGVIDASIGEMVYSQAIDFIAGDVYWSPDGGQIMAFGEAGEAAILPASGDPDGQPLLSQEAAMMWAAWSPDGSLLCAVCDDEYRIRVWDAAGHLRAVLEGHTDNVRALEFGRDGRLLYSAGKDSTLRCWRTDTWQCVATIEIGDDHRFIGGLTCSPTRSVLARRAYDTGCVELFQIDTDRVLMVGATSSRTYANAKVVLLGETGVGKSGLGLVLSGQSYEPTDSTHARQVWTFDINEIELSGGLWETREILLWDLAGQPGYRLIHQLHLVEAAVALIVFDARSENDPFVGVRYWMRALRQYRDAGRIREAPVSAILVAARMDRGGIAASQQRIAALCEELGIMAYLETSAKEGSGISELAQTVREAIDWAELPRSVSTELFEAIKRFLVEERDSDRELASGDDLFRLFTRRHPDRAVDDVLRAAFGTCVRLLESRDLVRRLSLGGFVLLRPELLDAYASALIDAARGQPDGLGYISEDDALAGRFPIPEDARLRGRGEERLLLIATVEELLRHDLALREPTDEGIDLIFPSQFTQDRPNAPDPNATEVVFRFDGAVTTVYATLAVRLSHVTTYRREEMWRNSSAYRARAGGRCGLRVREVDEGRGELVLFFDEDASEETRFLFEDYVQAHLVKRALASSVQRERVFGCYQCGYRFPLDLVRRRRSRGHTDMLCPICEEARISLLDREDRLSQVSMYSVREMNESADAVRDRAAATAIIRGKEALGDYDVFLSYNSKDRAVVTVIAEQLLVEGVLPWFDTRDVAPGRRWHDELERQIRKVSVGAVFVGPHGFGPWQDMEQQAFVNEYAKREFRIIPVLLPGVRDDVELPVFLGQWQVVDFRVAEPDPFRGLLSAITGERSRGGLPS